MRKKEADKHPLPLRKLEEGGGTAGGESAGGQVRGGRRAGSLRAGRAGPLLCPPTHPAAGKRRPGGLDLGFQVWSHGIIVTTKGPSKVPALQQDPPLGWAVLSGVATFKGELKRSSRQRTVTLEKEFLSSSPFPQHFLVVLM